MLRQDWLAPNLRPVACSAYDAFPLYTVDDKLYFFQPSTFGNSTLWVSDGSASGTQPIASNLQDGRIYDVDGTAYIYGYSPTEPFGYGLRKSNGTASGTVFIKRLSLDVSTFNDIVEKNGIAYFFAMGPNFEFGLWRSDGSSNGTVQMFTFPNHGPSTSTSAGDIELVNGKIFFTTTTTTRDSVTLGEETTTNLYVSNGTASGTQLLKTFNARVSNTLKAVDNKLYFVGYDEVHGYELWTSDGTVAGTKLEEDFTGDSGSGMIHRKNLPPEMIEFKNKLYVVATTEATGIEIFYAKKNGNGSVSAAPSVAAFGTIAPATTSDSSKKDLRTAKVQADMSIAAPRVLVPKAVLSVPSAAAKKTSAESLADDFFGSHAFESALNRKAKFVRSES